MTQHFCPKIFWGGGLLAVCFNYQNEQIILKDFIFQDKILKDFICS